ncbi:MAG TPA: hypothetical protein VHF22_02975 [Planctomycetota bacterium]|nr:hypothetical protein [Planctomycetota bacterium]
MALVDPAEFERGRALAVAEWKRSGEPKVAAAFEALRFEKCGFGMDPRARLCWAVVNGLRIGLAFGLESGEYERSFVTRMSQRPPRA